MVSLALIVIAVSSALISVIARIIAIIDARLIVLRSPSARLIRIIAKLYGFHVAHHVMTLDAAAISKNDPVAVNACQSTGIRSSTAKD
jgi:hypothetical protein